ncbi:MAG: ABC transporter permease subunit [Terracidiphilus sp.]
MNFQHPLARSLVIVRKTPFLVDLGVAACALALFFAIVSTGVYWFQKPIPVVPISNSIGALPLYAFYSIVRMAIAYLLSLAFAVSYGYIAAYNSRVEPWMVAVLDILQSIPVLSFLPPVVLAMVSLVPGHQLGIEMAVILLIFTGQVWNLAFSFYSSLKTIPREMLEASRIYRFSGWQRFWQLEMPFSAIGLVWNSIVSVAGGWFALIFCETFTMGTRNFQLPGPGQLHSSRDERRRCARSAGGHCHGDSHRGGHRSTGVAAADCVERQIQDGAGGDLRTGHFTDSCAAAPIEDSRYASRPHLESRGRADLSASGEIERVQSCEAARADKFRQGVAGGLGAGFCRGDRGLLGGSASRPHASYRYIAGSAALTRRRSGDIPACQRGVAHLRRMDYSSWRGDWAEPKAGAGRSAAGADTRVSARHSLLSDFVNWVGEDRRRGWESDRLH